MNQSTSQYDSQPTGLIDLHAHLVPGVDDGPSTEKDSLEMIRMAEANGIEYIVATPHIFNKLNIIKDLEMILQMQEEFLEKIRLFSLKIQVLSGAEIFFTSNLREIFNQYKNLLTINRSCYFILEFPFDFIFPKIEDFIFKIQMDGWIPIIAHPERNQVIQRNPRMLFEMVQKGALSQVNAGSISGAFGPEAQATAFKLIHYNLVQVIASDAHSIRHRPPLLTSVYDHLKELDIEKADLLFKKNPLAILNDQGLPGMDDPMDPQKKVKFFDFIRSKIKS